MATADDVKAIFDAMPTQLNPDAAKVSPGVHASPNMTMSLAASDYVDLIGGKLNGQMAFMSGKLKIAGDMGMAMKMQTLFKRP